MKRRNITVLLIILLCILSFISLFIGVTDIRIQDILGGDTKQLQMLFISRLPRLLAILCTGVGMSVAGLLMQKLCMNKFVSPTTGATISSAQLGILIALLFFPASTLWERTFFAFLAAMVGTWIFVYFIQKIQFKDVIMVPLVGTVKELKQQAEIINRVAAMVFEEKGVKVDYKVGTMIEIPRAAITADQIAEVAEFFSFGTNDLTQMTFGYSRDDAGKFLPEYIRKGILKTDPFAVLDQEGVGRLVEMGVKLGRKTNADLKVGICGEHGGEPSSVIFCDSVGMNYVSCSPFRVPIARIAAAQAAIEE